MIVVLLGRYWLLSWKEYMNTLKSKLLLLGSSIQVERDIWMH